MLTFGSCLHDSDKAVPVDNPAAIPVVTQEEAEELNAEAMEYAVAEKEKKEPFFRLYKNEVNDKETITFEGTVKAVSSIPDPENNDYPNCLYALFVEIDSLLSDLAPGTKIASEVIINTPIMKDKRIIDSNRFLLGDKIVCCCAEFDDMPQGIQEIQLSDDIQSFEHQQLFPFSIEKISSFSTTGNRDFAKREITILPIQSLPKDEKASNARKERIAKEIARIEDELKKHGGSFMTWKEEYKQIKERYKELCKDKWSGWINDSYFTAGGDETGYRTKEYIEGIRPYKKYLEENNIDLIVLRIPSKWDFAARVLASDEFQENPAWVEHYYECLKNDIEIVDPMPEMWEHRFDYPLFYFYSPNDGHPFEGASLIAAKNLSEILRRYGFEKEENRLELTETAFLKTAKPEYFWPKGNDKYSNNDPMTFVQVIQNEETIGGLSANTGSPLFFLGNSYFATPSKALGASIPAYTGYFLQVIPNFFYRSGGGNGLLRTLVSDNELLSFRNVVVMVGHPNFWRQTTPPLPPYLLESDTTVLSLEKKIIDFKHEISVIEKSQYTLAYNDDNQLEIDQGDYLEKDKALPTFSFELGIPAVQCKKSCMVRLYFSSTANVNFSIADKDTKEVLEQLYTCSRDTDHCDFFMPVSLARNIIVKISLPILESKIVIKRIELWYY